MDSCVVVCGQKKTPIVDYFARDVFDKQFGTSIHMIEYRVAAAGNRASFPLIFVGSSRSRLFSPDKSITEQLMACREGFRFYATVFDKHSPAVKRFNLGEYDVDYDAIFCLYDTGRRVRRALVLIHRVYKMDDGGVFAMYSYYSSLYSKLSSLDERASAKLTNSQSVALVKLNWQSLTKTRTEILGVR